MLSSLMVSGLILFVFVCLLWMFAGPEDFSADLD